MCVTSRSIVCTMRQWRRYECFARFEGEPYRSPDQWFAEAEEVGLAVELEIALARKALEALASLPKDILLTVNFSPATIMAPAFEALLNTLPLERVVLEVTEHAAVANYSRAGGSTASVPAIAGCGWRWTMPGRGIRASAMCLDLRPDTIKLDMSLTRNIDRDQGGRRWQERWRCSGGRWAARSSRRASRRMRSWMLCAVWASRRCRDISQADRCR